MNSLTDRVVRCIGRHFVSLSCVQHPPAPEVTRVHVFSGFVVEIMGEWFYMTAGHILKDLRTAMDAGSVFDEWRLGDQTAGNKFNNVPVPYDFQLEQWSVLEDESTGLDYAAVHLGGLFRQQLEAGGVAPITKQAWGDHITQHDHWILAGIPRESISYDDTSNITAKFVMVPLLPTKPPPLPEQKAGNQFFAKLADGSEKVVSDIVGMSGGPIIMLWKVDNTWKYSIIGVQSAWYPKGRIIAACPFPSFAEALEPVVEEALTRLKHLN